MSLNEFAVILKRIHDFIATNVGMNDKALHFLVIGVAGLILFFVSYPLFKFFDVKDNALAMTSVYTAVVILIFIVAAGLVQGINLTSIGIIAIIGVLVFVCSFQVFKYLDIKDKALSITNFFTITIVAIMAIAIELCQGITRTGGMEIADALYGIFGYLCMYSILCIMITLLKAISRQWKSINAKKGH